MSSDASSPRTAVNPAIIPLSVLCAGLVLGGVAAVFLTRRIARARLLLELRVAAEAKAAEDRLGAKPVLVDVYVGPSPRASAGLPWPTVQPIATKLHEDVCSPHPHTAIEHRPGYARAPLIDGNVLQLSVGIAMPSRATRHAPGAEDQPTPIALESLEYCIGTSDVVVCSLLGARQRLIGIN